MIWPAETCARMFWRATVPLAFTNVTLSEQLPNLLPRISLDRGPIDVAGGAGELDPAIPDHAPVEPVDLDDAISPDVMPLEEPLVLHTQILGIQRHLQSRSDRGQCAHAQIL